MLFPWHQESWDKLTYLKQTARLPHALLLLGDKGLGNHDLAQQFAQFLLCQQPTTTFCGNCHMCRLVSNGAHPNLLWIEPEKAGGMIKIDQMREISEFLSQSALVGSQQIVIIDPADEMNINAANALLKTLEEPNPNCLLILISEDCKNLPATVLSRCQRLPTQTPTRDVVKKWLHEQGHHDVDEVNLLLNLYRHAPLTALEHRESLKLRNDFLKSFFELCAAQLDPLVMARKIDPDHLSYFLELLHLLIKDMIWLMLGVEEVTNADVLMQLKQLSAKTNTERCLHFSEQLQQIQRDLLRGINFNKQLLFENLFLQLKKCFNTQAQLCN